MPRPRKQAQSWVDDKFPDPADAPGVDEDEPGDGADRRPSKSALKRQAHELQRLGDALIALRPEQLASMPVDEALREAIELARRIRAREGLRRQRQLIGKLMRDADADAIRATLEAGSASHRAEVALARAAEDWRDRLLADHTALQAFQRRFGADPEDPALARLIEQARAERAGTRSGGSYRSLYRMLLAAMRSHEAAGRATASQEAPREHP
ncbi:MAG: DUF615 domain-containing protein [Burkholderiaceae bacterium]|nr:DUF615 domain-containing protein [Burkholderiaceae bacterium]